jgi:hypothetical protein
MRPARSQHPSSRCDVRLAGVVVSSGSNKIEDTVSATVHVGAVALAASPVDVHELDRSVAFQDQLAEAVVSHVVTWILPCAPTEPRSVFEEARRHRISLPGRFLLVTGSLRARYSYQ